VGGYLEIVYSSIPRRRRSQLLVHPTSPHRSDGWDGLVWSGVSKAPPAHHSRDSDCDTEKQCPRIRSQHLWTQHLPTQSRPPSIPTPPRLHASNYTAIIPPPNLLSPPLPEPSLTPTFRLSLLRLYIPATTSLHVPSNQPNRNQPYPDLRQGAFLDASQRKTAPAPPAGEKRFPGADDGGRWCGLLSSVQFRGEERRDGGWWVVGRLISDDACLRLCGGEWMDGLDGWMGGWEKMGSVARHAITRYRGPGRVG
jgi:hypothetical protein